MYFMKRWHFPQRDRGFPVAAMGEKETSINSSMPVTDERHSVDWSKLDLGMCLNLLFTFCSQILLQNETRPFHLHGFYFFIFFCIPLQVNLKWHVIRILPRKHTGGMHLISFVDRYGCFKLSQSLSSGHITDGIVSGLKNSEEFRLKQTAPETGTGQSVSSWYGIDVILKGCCEDWSYGYLG